METDLAFAATGPTFVRVYADVYAQMVARRYYRHREERRAMPPNFRHVARSDATRTGERGWRTRWRWLEYPTEVYGEDGDAYSDADIVKVARDHLTELVALRRRAPNISVRLLTRLPPVPRFCAESAFLHHTLEHAPVVPLRGVSLARREERCPDGGRRRRGLRECTGWLVD